MNDLEASWREIAEKNRAAFLGKYKSEINLLMGISRADIDAITPDTTDLQVYDQLIEVVKEASRKHIAQAELKNRIVALGDIAVKIARHVPTLGQFLD